MYYEERTIMVMKIPREFSLIACEKLLKIYYNIIKQ